MKIQQNVVTSKSQPTSQLTSPIQTSFGLDQPSVASGNMDESDKADFNVDWSQAFDQKNGTNDPFASFDPNIIKADPFEAKLDDAWGATAGQSATALNQESDPFASTSATMTGPIPTSMSFDGFGTDENWASVSNSFATTVTTTNTHTNNIKPSNSLSSGLKTVTESNKFFDNSQTWTAFDNGILFFFEKKRPKSKLQFEYNKLIS
jgi:hypothetical protein